MKDIYIIRNVINGKVYIGQTYNVDERWSRHVYDTKNHTTNMPLHEDMRIYGIDNFNYTVIEQCSDEVANEREQFWINYFNATGDNGYNVCIGGAGVGTGVNHPKARLNQEQLDLLVNDLKYSGLSNAKLAKKYNCSETTVQFINNGQAYYNPNLTYPLKKNNRYDKEKIKQIKYALKYELDKSINDIAKEFNVNVSQVHDMNQGKIHAFSNEIYPLRSGLNKGIMSEENVNLVINDLIYSDLKKHDIAKKYNVSDSCISKINSGINSFCPNNLEYPIRAINKKDPSTIKRFTLSEIEEIENLLLYDTISINEIAKKYNCDKTTIYHINNGDIKKYRNPNKKYPLRETRNSIR